MKVGRFRHEDAIFYGIVDGKEVKKVCTTLEELLSNELGDHGIYKEENLELLSPIGSPLRNVFCLGKNYLNHVREMSREEADLSSVPNAPIYFSKACREVTGHQGTVKGHFEISATLDYEVELVVIIGKKGINIKKENARDYIYGYTVGNDFSMREVQKGRKQWLKGKSLDTHTAMGPYIVFGSEVPYPPEINLSSYVNDELRQSGNTSEMIFDIGSILEDLSEGMTLYPGDIIFTGTPAGVGMGFDPPRYLKMGDKVTCVIEGIGTLENVII